MKRSIQPRSASRLLLVQQLMKPCPTGVGRNSWRRLPIGLVCAGWLLSVSAMTGAPTLPNINTSNIINITDYGANVGNADNAGAIQSAIDVAAAGGLTNGGYGGTVEVPAGIYLSGPLVMKSYVNLQVDAGAILRMLPFGQFPGSDNANGAKVNFIGATNLTDVEISGSGAIDGQGQPYWHALETNSAFLRPIMIRIQGCSRQLIQGVTLSNSPMFHISISSSKGNATVQGVTILAPPSSGVANPSHNTDACDVSGTNILVQNCSISVGDDDFTCGGGTSDVLITNNTYGNGHGVSIGSYTQGVSNILVINCTFNGTDNGIRIKSDNDRSGYVRNISYYNIGMTNVHFPIQIYGYYNEVGTPGSISPYYASTQAVAAVTGTTPIFRDITFSNISATSISGYPVGIIWARTELPATNIVFNRVNVTGNRNFCLYNVSGAQFIDSKITVTATSNSFALFNAQVIITNTAPTNTLFTFNGLVTNGYGNNLALYNALGALKNTNVLDESPLTLANSTFTISNNFKLFPATILNFLIGSNSATISVISNLTLGGTINVADDGGFTNGTYTLLTCGKTLGGLVPAIGSAPAGYNYAFDTNTAGQVKLVATLSIAPPLAPTNLLAAATNGAVALSWSPSATAAGYNVKRSTNSGGSYTTIAGGLTVTNYSDSQVMGGVMYYYVVSAINGGGEGPDSSEVSVTAPWPLFIIVGTNVLVDEFSWSTLNSSSPATPTATNASYELISSKPWNPAPSMTAGHLKFGIGATSSGSVEVQALFLDSPVTLANVGDSISLTVNFVNASNLLAVSSTMGFGLYASGQNAPVPGGLNGTATTASTGNAAGYAQPWSGYVGQLALTGTDSRIMTRPPQITGDLFNNDQDAVTSGSNSSSYTNNPPVMVGTTSSAGSVTLNTGDPYTEVLTLTLVGDNTLAITNLLYAGTDTNGVLLSQFGGVASGATYLTNRFDALAVGWRATANTSATAIDINRISIDTFRTLSLAPTNLVSQVVGNQLQLSWPQDYLGWHLQIQTNRLDTGLGNNWVDVPGSAATNEVFLPINPDNGPVFLRLAYP